VKHNAELIFVHVIEVHEGKVLMAGLEEAERIKPLFAEAESWPPGRMFHAGPSSRWRTASPKVSWTPPSKRSATSW
jgi:hypothetical protein